MNGRRGRHERREAQLHTTDSARTRRAALAAVTGLLALSAGAGPAGVAAQPAGTAFVGAQDPAWSPDGTRVAFAADCGAGFDIYVAAARRGEVTAVTTQPGDERWPSFMPDGRLVFASRAPRNARVGPDPGAQWDLQMVRPVDGSPAWQAPVALTDTPDNETYPRVAPDGSLVAFVSERGADDDVDIWGMPLPAATATPVPLGARVARTAPEAAQPPRPTRVVRATGAERHLSWAPDSTRLAFHGVRGGVGAVWVATVELPQTESTEIGRKGEVRYGYASAVLVDVAARTIEGGAEPRRSHAAVAAERPGTSAQP